jgi:2-oxo-3-hexenedioate decarboxylase
LSQEEQALFTLVQQARNSRRAVLSQSPSPVLNLDAAYRLQARLGEGRVLKGYKLGLISLAKQSQMGIDAPIYGQLYADMIVQSPIMLNDFIQPKFEPELVVALKQDIPAGATLEMARQAISAAYLGIDILDSIWAGYHFSIVEVIVDNASGGGFLRDAHPLQLPVEGTLRLSLNGDLLVGGSLADLGQVERRLVWLAHQVNGLAAEQIIYLGSPVAAQSAEPGIVELCGPQGRKLTFTFVR